MYIGTYIPTVCVSKLFTVLKMKDFPCWPLWIIVLLNYSALSINILTLRLSQVTHLDEEVYTLLPFFSACVWLENVGWFSEELFCSETAVINIPRGQIFGNSFIKTSSIFWDFCASSSFVITFTKANPFPLDWWRLL